MAIGKRLISFAFTMLFACSITPALSQTNNTASPSSTSDSRIEEVVVIGTRANNRTAKDLPVPVDTLTSQDLRSTGHSEVGRMLQSLAPSFNFSSSSISDGTDALRPATLRGLGPDQTLVLVNGKRRHQASLLHINTSVGRGTAGTDLNAIPAASIKRIEVLRDGAAAQYGSDAIAGIINIVLDDAVDEGSILVSKGEYTEGDGDNLNVDIRNGFKLGDRGYLNVAANFRDRESTNRAGLHGSCQFSGCIDSDGDGILEPGDEREVTAPRQTFRIGDAESEQVALTVNSAYELGDGELYGFITYSGRDNESAAFFRHNANNGGNAPLADGDATIPAGFLPKINSAIDDVSYNIGYRVNFDNGASLDFSYTTGTNSIDYTTSDSLDSSFANQLTYSTDLDPDTIRATVPRQAYAYGLELGLDTVNLDFTQSYGDLFFAMGVELRTDEYKILAGEEYAYHDYDPDNGVSLYADDRSGGIQGFPGIAPESAVDESREVFSFYLDGEYDVSDHLRVSAAARYDSYEGFGDTTNFKVAGAYVLSDAVRLRAAASTGFRAPSMQQLFFNNVGTQFVVDVNDVDNNQDVTELVAQQVGTFRNDSELARSIGIPELTEENSTNFSAGIVADINDSLSVTVDFYQIDIDDRIVISNRLGDNLGSAALSAALLQAGAGEGQFFLNGADTSTSGVDFVATYSDIALFKGVLDLTLAGNFTSTDVDRIFTPDSSSLSDIPATEIFSAQDISIIEEWQPESRIALNAKWIWNEIYVNLAFNQYGEYAVTDGARQVYGSKVLTDLRISYEYSEELTLAISGNNVFDVYPDTNTIGNSRTGAIENGPDGSLIVDSAGVFKYSRRAAPFGFNGAFWSASATYEF